MRVAMHVFHLWHVIAVLVAAPHTSCFMFMLPANAPCSMFMHHVHAHAHVHAPRSCPMFMLHPNYTLMPHAPVKPPNIAYVTVVSTMCCMNRGCVRMEISMLWRGKDGGRRRNREIERIQMRVRAATCAHVDHSMLACTCASRQQLMDCERVVDTWCRRCMACIISCRMLPVPRRSHRHRRPLLRCHEIRSRCCRWCRHRCCAMGQQECT